MLTIPFMLEDGAREPRRAHPDDAGFDLAVIERTRVPMGGHTVANTGVRVNIPAGYVGKLFVRSSIGVKRHVCLSNGTGIIDAGYTGTIKASLHNESRDPVWFHAGEFVLQLVVEELPRVELWQVESLGESERAEAGFGSSGNGLQ